MADEQLLPSRSLGFPDTLASRSTATGLAEFAKTVDMSSSGTPIPTKYPRELGTPGPFEKWMLFEARDVRHVGRRGGAAESVGQVDRTLASVQLYVPAEALNSTITASYDTNDIGPFMGVLSEASSRNPELISSFSGIGTVAADLVNFEFTDAAKNTLGVAKDLWSTVAKTATNVGGAPTIGQAALAAVLKMADEKFAGGAIPQALGFRPNPRTDVLFSHIGYRTHRMEYMLIPRNEEEARAIDKIIKFFQFYMLPTYSPTIGVNQDIEGLLMGFPYEFEISFWSEGRPTLHHFNKIGRSVLTNVSVDHAGGSQVAFFRASNGELFPAVTKLSLEFQEVRLLARDEEMASTSASGKGLIDRGDVGNFDDPRRDRLAEIDKKIRSIKIPEADTGDFRQNVPSNPIPGASSNNPVTALGKPGEQGSGLGKQAESARSSSLYGAGNVG